MKQCGSSQVSMKCEWPSEILGNTAYKLCKHWISDTMGLKIESSVFLKTLQRILQSELLYYYYHYYNPKLRYGIRNSSVSQRVFFPPPQTKDESPGFPQTLLLQTTLSAPKRRICKVNLGPRLYSKEQEINLLYSWHLEIVSPQKHKNS